MRVKQVNITLIYTKLLLEVITITTTWKQLYKIFNKPMPSPKLMKQTRRYIACMLVNEITKIEQKTYVSP